MTDQGPTPAPLTVEDLAAAAEAGARRALALSSTTSIRPGTTQGITVDAGPVDVLMDGDTVPIAVRNVTGFFLPAGTRVLVAQPPPNGAHIIGSIDPIRKARLAAGFGATVSMLNNTLTSLTPGTWAGDTDIITGLGPFAVAQVDGVYDLDATIEFAMNTVGHRLIEFTRNSSERIIGPVVAPAAGTATRLTYRTTYSLLAGDTIEVRGRQTSGGALDTFLARVVVTREGPRVE